MERRIGQDFQNTERHRDIKQDVTEQKERLKKDQKSDVCFPCPCNARSWHAFVGSCPSYFRETEGYCDKTKRGRTLCHVGQSYDPIPCPVQSAVLRRALEPCVSSVRLKELSCFFLNNHKF